MGIIASLDIDAQKGFTPLCPNELPVAGFQGILKGEYDDLPEQAFYMVGGIDEVVEKSKKL